MPATMSWRVNRLVLAGGACVEVNRGAVQLVVRVLNSCLYPGLRLPQSSDRCRLCARGTNRAAATAEGVKAWAKAINGVVLGRLVCPRWLP